MPTAVRRLLTRCVLLALFLLAACSGSSTRSRTGATLAPIAMPPPVTISWSFWGDAWEEAINRRAARAFERAHPGIRVRLLHQSWDQYFDWLRAEWAAGRSPDVMFLNAIPTYAATGELEPLDRYIARDREPLDDFYPALLDGFRAGGRLYGLPRDNDTKVIFYNRDHFTAAGITEPVEDWTWEDLRRVALALTRRDLALPRYGLGIEIEYWWQVWFWQNGGDVVDHPLHPTKTVIDSQQNVETLQFLSALINTDRVTPPLSQLITSEMVRLFREGRLSMLFGNHALVPPLAETGGLNWDVAPLPKGLERANVAGGAGYVMSHRSPYPDAAWALIRFLTSRKGQAIFAESGVITPARRSVREDHIFLRRRPYQAEVFLSETEVGRTVPNFLGVAEMNRLINIGLVPVWRGEQSAAEALRELAPQVQAIISSLGSSR